MLIERKTTETIYPSSSAVGAAAESPGKQARVLIRLSNIDQQTMMRRYTSMILFFESTIKGPPEEEDQSAMAADGLLRGSLEETLGVFYPCAGRYVEREGDGGFDVEYAGQGALFCVAMADSTIRDCMRDSGQPSPELALLVADPPPDDSITRLPLLTVQVTHFKGGGMCLGIRMHHNLCDGMSLAHFMRSWSEVTQGGKAISLLPRFDRGRLLVNKDDIMHGPPDPPLDRPEYQATMPALPSPWPAMRSKIFSFTPTAISLLKAKANEGRSGSSTVRPSFTAFETLAGHLWRSITRARGLDPAQEVRLGMAVDGRGRFDPPLDEGYFGNVIFYGYTATRAEDLVANPLSHAVAMVKKAVASVSDEYMRGALEWLERQDSPASISSSFCNPFTDLSISSWLSFPFYELDFGWGKPSLIRIPFYGEDGLVILIPSPLGKGHIDAFLGLKAEHMSRLESDPEFVPTLSHLSVRAKM